MFFHSIKLAKEIKGLPGLKYIEEIKLDTSDKVIEFSDKFIIIERTKWHLKTFFKWNAYILLTIVIAFLILDLFDEEFYLKISQRIYFYLKCSYLMLNLLLAYYAFLSPKKKLIFDRQNGIVFLPQLFFLKTKRIKFKSLEASYLHRYDDGSSSEYDDISSSTTTLHLRSKYYGQKYKYKKIVEHNTTQRASVEYLWYFMIWYMDKNRPLPYDKEFDSYRYIDYERRRKEGFPKALYKSSFLIKDKSRNRKKEKKGYF